MKKAVFLVGVPGTGKTTTTVTLMSALPEYTSSVSGIKMIPWVELNRRDGQSWRFLGVFGGRGYAQGTDRMSMGVQPHFVEFARTNDTNLFIEGDRLCNAGSIEACLAYRYSVHVVELTADAGVRQQRYQLRGSAQSETFIKGRVTKLFNLRLHMAGDHPHMSWKRFKHEVPRDSALVHHHLLGLIRD